MPHSQISSHLFRWTKLGRIIFTFALLFGYLVGDRAALAQGKQPTKPATKPKTDNKTKKKNADANGPFVDPDPEYLPPWYQAPPERLAIKDLDQPIATDAELKALKKENDKAAKALLFCDLSESGRQSIVAAIRYKLAEMTLRDKRNDLPRLHTKIVENVTNIGGPNEKPAAKAAMAEFVGKEILKQIPELLKNNYYVRLHAVNILGEIDYFPAYALLLQVVQAKDILDDPVDGQPIEIKICAVNGLIRIIKFTSPPVAVRSSIARTAIDELKNPKSFPWYQERLIEVLRNSTISVDPLDNNRPFVIESLLSIIKDPERTWKVRATACYALGRVPIPASININDLAFAVAEFTQQLAVEAAGNPKNPDWKWCFGYVYFAFQPLGTKDKTTGKDLDLDAEGKFPGGFLARYKRETTPAYNLIYPFFRDVLHDKMPDPQDVKNLSEFVKK